MRFLILSKGRAVHATGRLVDEAAALGHTARVVDPDGCCVVSGPGGGVFSVTGHPVAVSGDVVVPRIGSGARDEGVAVVEALERGGVPSLNPSAALRLARDKLRCLRTADAAGIRIPRTALIRSPAQLDVALEAIGGLPAVVKLRFGSQGVGEMLARDRDAADSNVQTLCSLAQGVLLQEIVGPAPGGSDLRIVVVAGTAVASMERHAARDTFRANVHRGGRVRAGTPGREVEAMACEAAATLGLGLAGVDLVLDDDGPSLLEVNGSPGFEGVERVTGVNVARAAIAAAARLGSPTGGC